MALRSTGPNTGVALGALRGSARVALSLLGSVVGALHVKFWQTKAVAGLFPCGACTNSCDVVHYVHCTVLLQTHTKSLLWPVVLELSEEASMEQARSTWQHHTAQSRGSLPVHDHRQQPRPAASDSARFGTAENFHSRGKTGVTCACLQAGPLNHGERLGVVAAPELHRGLVRGVDDDDGLLWSKWRLRGRQQRFHVCRAAPPRDDHLPQVPCTQAGHIATVSDGPEEVLQTLSDAPLALVDGKPEDWDVGHV